jgi:hypothetical protein
MSRLNQQRDLRAADVLDAAIPFTTQTGLEDMVEKLSADLHGQYLLSFVPREFSPGYHRLEVEPRRACPQTEPRALASGHQRLLPKSPASASGRA